MKLLTSLLVVEDNDDDLILLKRAFKRAGIENPVHVVPDGQEALDYLLGMAQYSDRSVFPVPGLVLLDVKLPRLSGFDVLGRIRTEPGLQTLIIVILSSSNQPADVQRAYDLGANAYLVKPGSFDELVTFAKAFKSYWLDMNNAPPARILQDALPPNPASRNPNREGMIE